MKKSIVWGLVIALGIGSFLGGSIYHSSLPKEETLSLEGLTSQLNSERKGYFNENK